MGIWWWPTGAKFELIFSQPVRVVGAKSTAPGLLGLDRRTFAGTRRRVVESSGVECWQGNFGFLCQHSTRKSSRVPAEGESNRVECRLNGGGKNNIF